jgi:hypothetical protein
LFCESSKVVGEHFGSHAEGLDEFCGKVNGNLAKH